MSDLQKKSEECINSLVEIYEYSQKLDNDLSLKHKFLEMINSYGMLDRNKYINTLMKYFNAIFMDISSNSTILSNGKPTITLGRYGIGIRTYRQAKPLNSYNDISFYLLKYNDSGIYDRIVEGLKSRKKFNKAEEFEKIIELFKIIDCDKDFKFNIELDKPVNIIMSSPIFKKLECNKISFEYNNDRILLKTTNNNNEYYFINSIKECYNHEEVFNNFLLDEQLESIFKKFSKMVNEVKQKQDIVLKKLEKEFGRYIMALSL